MSASLQMLLGFGLDSPPKVVQPISWAAVSFDQVLSNKLHSTLAIRPTASKKIILEAPVRKDLTVPLTLGDQSSSIRPTAREIQHNIIAGIVTNFKDVKTIASLPQDPIIIQGAKEKKRILSDYQVRFGSNYPDSIIT